MPTFLDALKSVSSYPIPMRTLEEVALRRGVDIQREVFSSILRSTSYRLATADLLMWLSVAPNVSQGGQTYSFTDEQRQQFVKRANAIYNDLEDSHGEAENKAVYGYKGTRL